MCPDSPENKCPTVECPDCGGQGSDEGGFRGGKKWKAICPRCGGSGRINTSGPDDSKIENKYQGSPSVPDREGECPDCEGESIEGRGCRTCNSTGRVVSPSQTEGGGPDDTKQVSKEQGASPSVTPGVTKNVGDDRTDETDENYAFGNDAAIWICRHAGDYFPHPECPFDCDCKPVRYIRAATNQTQEAVADPKKDPGPVDPVLFSLCVERVARSMVDDRATPLDRPLTVVVTPKAFAKYTVDLIAPLLLEAGAKQERERVKARVEDFARVCQENGDMISELRRKHPSSSPHVDGIDKGRAGVYRNVAESLRAALAAIDKEGPA